MPPLAGSKFTELLNPDPQYISTDADVRLEDILAAHDAATATDDMPVSPTSSISRSRSSTSTTSSSSSSKESRIKLSSPTRMSFRKIGFPVR
ncbi:hypothetical protein FQN52_008642 [Onygenales sp. PD_12]|nr:hypothetical protein FQN52_008642 [Onygenales sp. PD_12]KAK2805057.1 hypothetical protein FQN51_001152 [Onygenales sp. PD_10]